ncbi:hypothetical protein, partial [Streptomyces sp. NPDC001919]
HDRVEQRAVRVAEQGGRHAVRHTVVGGAGEQQWAGVAVSAVLLLSVLARRPRSSGVETPGKNDDSVRRITERSPQGSFPSA